MEGCLVSVFDKILDFFKSSKSENKKKKKLTLFNIEDYERPGYANYKKCPNCETEANTNKEIKSTFGLMNVGGHTYSQSWCRECRKIQPQEKNLEEGSKEDGIFN